MQLKGALVFLVVALVTGVRPSPRCPAKENIPNCSCSTTDGAYKVDCYGLGSGKTINDYRDILLDSFPEGSRLNLIFRKFTKPSNLTSDLFDGLKVETLQFLESNVPMYADEDGGPALVGLEDNLKELRISKSFLKPKRTNYYEEEKASFTFGHLRQIRKIRMDDNRLYHLDNKWFGNGPTSLEILNLEVNQIYVVEDRALAALTNLKELNLKNNKILEISRSMFPNPASHLEILDIGFNVLRDLPLDMFDNMPALKQVDLTNNELKFLRERTWKPIWSQLDILFFDYNHLRCSDHIEWTFKERPPKLLFARCLSPVPMKDKILSDLIADGSRGCDKEKYPTFC